jgi:hypothetical protein
MIQDNLQLTQTLKDEMEEGGFSSDSFQPLSWT